jgi:hypothetical protein
MGRRPTTPKGATGVSAKLPPALQIGLHQLALNRWQQTGRKTDQNELFIEAVEDLLKSQGIDISQIEKATAQWNEKQTQTGTITTFRKKRPGGRRA